MRSRKLGGVDEEEWHSQSLVWLAPSRHQRSSVCGLVGRWEMGDGLALGGFLKHKQANRYLPRLFLPRVLLLTHVWTLMFDEVSRLSSSIYC